MKLYDILMVLLIFIIFGILIGHKTVSVQVNNINEDWPQQRCNPLFMPFADDPVQNFTFCIQKAQKEFMDDLLMPMNNTMNVFGKTMNDTLGSLNNVRELFNYIRNSIVTTISAIYGVFLNIIIEFQRSTIAVKDMVGKMMGVMVSLIYMVDGSVKTAESTWNGPPGKLIRGLCFYKDTLLQRENGTYETIGNIELGARLKDGSEIVGKLILNNLNKNGTVRERFLRLPQGEKKTSIYVTPLHLIMTNEGKWDYVKNHPDAVACSHKTDVLHCLVTDTSRIHIGDYVFHDWEDTPEMHASLH